MNGFDILPCHNQYKVSSKETFLSTKDVIIHDENHFKHRFQKAGYIGDRVFSTHAVMGGGGVKLI